MTVAVGAGKHYIYIDEGEMPLPWTLNQKAYVLAEIKLRRTKRLAIPIYKLGE